jgi:hypothetical protein
MKKFKDQSPSRAEIQIAVDILRDSGAKIVQTPKTIMVVLKVK